MLPLFAYGSLRDPDYQRELFGRSFPMQRAFARGFTVVTTGGGYFAATACPGQTVEGMLVELDEAAYPIADAWEDLTVYDRMEIDVRDAAEGIRRCFIYVQSGARGEAVMDGRLTDRSREQVIADIRRFRASLQAPTVKSDKA